VTADGTYRPSTRVTTRDELDALPVGSVVLADATHQDSSQGTGSYPLAFQRLYDGKWHRGGRSRDTDPDFITPATVLFRPDAPQPVTEDGPTRESEAAHAAFCDEYERGRRDALAAASAVSRPTLADAWDEGRQWLAEQGGDVSTDGNPNPYRTVAGAGEASHSSLGEPTVAPGTVYATGVNGTISTLPYGTGANPTAGAEVDREALATLLTGHHLVYDEDAIWPRCVCGWTASTNAAYPDLILAGHQTDLILAARGDAAPTEVEWGVREDDGDWTIFAEALDPNAQQNAQEWATTAGSPLMQRTVSAWSEVTP